MKQSDVKISIENYYFTPADHNKALKVTEIKL